MTSSVASFVLLGVPDEPIDVSAVVDFTTTKCGGRCDPPPPFTRADVENSVRCGVCGGSAAADAPTSNASTTPGSSSVKLVCQIYCPLTGSRFHRTLFIFACVNRGCWNRDGSWQVVRAQAVCEEEEEEEKVDGLEEEKGKKNELFDLDDDWEDDDDDDGVERNDGECGKRADVNSNVTSVLSPSSNFTQSPSIFAAPTNAGDSSDDEDVNSLASESSAKDADDVDDDDGMVVDDVVAEESGRRPSQFRSELVASSNSTSSSTASSTTSSTFFDYFEPFYVACVEEQTGTDTSSLDFRAEKLLKEYKRREGDPEDEEFLDQLQNCCKVDRASAGKGGGKRAAIGGGGGSAAQLEKYEKGVPKHGDLVFQHFVEVLSSFPSQILRYSWSGSPLLMSPLPPPPSTTNSAGVDVDLVCGDCGARKVFEMQLLPTLLHFLERRRCGVAAGGRGDETDDDDDDGGGAEGGRESPIDFGTALVFSCGTSCWDEGRPKLTRETVILQGEPGNEFCRRGV